VGPLLSSRPCRAAATQVLCQLEGEGGQAQPSGWLQSLPVINRCFQGKVSVPDIVAALREERDRPAPPPAVEEALAALERTSPLSQVGGTWGGGAGRARLLLRLPLPAVPEAWGVA
jgi:hypothetical protein